MLSPKGTALTTAPANVKAVRSLLLAHLDIHENSSAYSTDLDPAEVGIVGDTAHVKEGNSYHLGLPQQSRSGYAATESSRDKAGLSSYASAIDIGDFSVTVNGSKHTLRTFSKWLVAECAKGAADTKDIREVIYSLDGKTVKRWDRLKKRSSGDSSHRWHTHISFFRDATKAGRDLTPLFRRYLTTIGLIKGGTSTPGPKPPTPAPALAVYTLGSRILARGMKGTDVRDAQRLLVNLKRPVSVDGDFGPKTEAAVKDFQADRWLASDGKIGPDTLGALRTNLGVRVLKKGLKGSDVKEIQRLLNAKGAKLTIDGDFGAKTDAAVRAFQKSHKLAVDGQAGKATVTALRK